MTAELKIALNAATIDRLGREGRTLGDESFVETLARRLCVGISLVEDDQFDDFEWRHVLPNSIELTIKVHDDINEALTAVSIVNNISVEAIVTTFAVAHSLAPQPSSSQPRASSGSSRRLEFLRRERGNGNVYRMPVELFGYQVALIRWLERHGASEREVFGYAFRGVALDVSLGRSFVGCSVHPDLKSLATRMAMSPVRP